MRKDKERVSILREKNRRLGYLLRVLLINLNKV